MPACHAKSSSRVFVVRVLYLFSGKRRKCDMRHWLEKLGKGMEVKVLMKEIDVLRGGKKHNMLLKAARGRILKEVEDGMYEAVIASPPWSTFTRARCTGTGPRPVRSARFPRGFPWLGCKTKKSACDANVLVDFASAVLRAHMC